MIILKKKFFLLSLLPVIFFYSALYHLSCLIIFNLSSLGKMSKCMGNITTSAKTGEITKSEEMEQPNSLDSEIDLFTL